MAISRNNALTKGASGMFGGVMVFKTWNGKTYISNRPKKPARESPLQKESRTRFKRATLFAQQMMKDPAKKAEYKAKAKQLNLTNAYTAAVTEFMRKPEITDVDYSEYSGKADQQVKIRAGKKDFGIEEVEITLTSKVGKLIEKGKAVRHDKEEWIYTTTSNPQTEKSIEIILKARDRTSNTTTVKISHDLPVSQIT